MYTGKVWRGLLNASYQGGARVGKVCEELGAAFLALDFERVVELPKKHFKLLQLRLRTRVRDVQSTVRDRKENESEKRTLTKERKGKKGKKGKRKKE